MEETIKRSYRESIKVKEEFFKKNIETVILSSRTIADAFTSGCKLLIIGNGGSAADAQHIAAEFVNRFVIERPPLPAIALTTDSSLLTSIGNDYEFEQVFSKQVKALGREGDVLLAISTSGSSANIIKALKTAGDSGITTIGLTGKDGGRMANMVDIHLHAESGVTARVQEVHITVCHIICELVDYILFQKAGRI